MSNMVKTVTGIMSSGLTNTYKTYEMLQAAGLIVFTGVRQDTGAKETFRFHVEGTVFKPEALTEAERVDWVKRLRAAEVPFGHQTMLLGLLPDSVFKLNQHVRRQEKQ